MFMYAAEVSVLQIFKNGFVFVKTESNNGNFILCTIIPLRILSAENFNNHTGKVEF